MAMGRERNAERTLCSKWFRLPAEETSGWGFLRLLDRFI
jgi:hypothetical protein